jgi:RNA polymerase sigma factor (sigma-70 family)
MDADYASALFAELRGHQIGGWQVDQLIGNGRSALVARASRGGRAAALKILDPDLILSVGEEAQLSRLALARRLLDHQHRHLVPILDEGRCGSTGYFYVAMAYVEAQPLSKIIDTTPPSSQEMVSIVSQIASAARFLESVGLAHRDINPDNVLFGDQTATLVGLGLLKAHSTRDTDDARTGSIRYCPPEVLAGAVDDSVEGWRAVTFYQLGALLHDLIAREKLFAAYEDASEKLIDAVARHQPQIRNQLAVEQTIVDLAMRCLLKSPKQRLEAVSWRAFDKLPTEAVTSSIRSVPLWGTNETEQWSDEEVMSVWVDSRRRGNGDQAAFGLLLHRHGNATYQRIHRLLASHPALVDDVSQETWLEVARATKYEPRNFRSYVLTIATRKSLDRLGSASLRTSSRKQDDQLLEDLPDETSTQGKRLEASEELNWILAQVSTMPPRQAAAWRLKYVEELNFEEIAEAMGTPLGTAKTRVRRPMSFFKRRSHVGAAMSGPKTGRIEWITRT